MAIAFVIPVYADPTAGLPTIPLLPSTITLDGLIHYWDPETSVLDITNVVSQVNPWKGVQKLTSSTIPTAPLIETISTKKFFKMERSKNTRLISGSSGPNGSLLEGDFTAGFSLSIVAKISNAALSNSLFSLGGFRGIVNTNATNIQIQKYYGTPATNLKTQNFTVPTLTGMSVVTVTYNPVTHILRIYVNGIFIGQSADVNWESPANGTLVLGNDYNTAGNSMEGNVGIVAIHNRVLTDSEVLFTSNGIKTLSALS